MLVNFLTNAADAIGERPGTIWIRTEIRDGALHVIVEDDGPGLPGGAEHKVTEPFFTTKDPGKGTGLGLAIALAIAKDHGGSLVLQNRSVGGCRAALCLPVLIGASGSPEQATGQARQP